MRHGARILATVAGMACAAGLAFAAEQTVLGKSLTVKDGKPGVDPTKRKVSASGLERNSPNTLVGSPTMSGTAGGAILEVFANGANSSSQVFVLAQGTSSTGKPFWSGDATKGFKYKDATGNQGAVKSVSIKRSGSGAFSVKITVSGKGGPLNVVPPNPGTDGCAALKLGLAPAAGDRYSLQFGPESKIKNSGDTLFSAKQPTAEGICPTVGVPDTPFSTTEIVKVAEATQAGYHAEFYENRAYTCGVSGYHTFVVAWPDGVPTSAPRPLWVRLHGGGVGAFNDAGEYVPSVFLFGSLDQETFAELAAFGLSDGLMASIRAHPAGFRAVIPSLCDHDLYAGVGLADPNNPFSPDENGKTRATDGLLAAEAAVAYARAQLATTATFVHGTSAGSFGAFNVAYGLQEHGQPVTGIVMDSGVLDYTANAAYEAHLEANPGACPSAGAAFNVDWDAMRARFAHLAQPLWEPAYAVEQGLFSTPVFQLWDRRDPNWCADTPIPYIDDDGTPQILGGSDLLNDDLRAAIAANPPGGPGASVSLRVCTVTGPSTCGVHGPTAAINGPPTAIDADTGLDINQAVVDWVDARLAAG